MRAAYPMNGQSRNYCVVLIAGSMRTHNKDWAGLVLATSRRGVTVKPLEVYRDDDVEIDDEDGGATKTAALRLRIAHAYPMKRLDGSAIMERLTFAPDGVGVVARRNAAADAPPMLTRKFRVDLTSAERAMVGAESPERVRGVVDDAIEDDGDGNRVSESIYSLFEVHRGESSIDESPPEDVADESPERESPAAIEPAPHADESAGDSISPERLGIIRRGSQSERGTQSEASASQAEGVDAAFVANDEDETRGGDEWKGSISFLREQLAAQGGVKLILNRVDVERLLEELTSNAPG